MSATTIKLEGPILNSVLEIKPADMSLSAFIRLLLGQAVLKYTLGKAARTYADFLAQNNAEAEWLDDWDQADLATSPKKKG